MRAASPTRRRAPLPLDEFPRLLADYADAARNAVAAGFDGVQIHAANGYLIDEFLRDGVNHRDDRYGGPVENRVRLLREVAESVAGAIGADRTGVRLSPNGLIQGVDDSHPEPLFQAAAQALSEVGVAYLELREPGEDGTFGKANRPALAPPNQVRLQRAADPELRLRRRARPGGAGRRPGRRNRLRPPLHLQPRPARADQGRRAAEQGQPAHLVQPGAGGLCRLSGAGLRERGGRSLSGDPYLIPAGPRSRRPAPSAGPAPRWRAAGS